MDVFVREGNSGEETYPKGRSLYRKRYEVQESHKY